MDAAGSKGKRGMLAKLKQMFGGGSKDQAKSKPPASASGTKTATTPPPAKRAKLSRANLSRRFTILTEIGQGSMSKVYRALDKQNGRSICLKVQIPEKNDAAAARANQEQRPHEGQIGLEINHPHIVKTYEFGISTRREHFVVMEFIDGQSLRFVREVRSAPRLADKLELLAQGAEGLAAVHAAGYIHHDVGPHNFLVTSEPRVKMIDFGLTIPNTPVFCRPGNRTGTLNYMAPELVRRETIDERIDIFAFGVMAFEFLTDKLPYDSSTSMAALIARMNHEPRDPAQANPNLPSELHEFLRKLTARKRQDRWARMSTVADVLRGMPTPND
jgi:serine/threonine protein kinase